VKWWLVHYSHKNMVCYRTALVVSYSSELQHCHR